jgi:hypothetical protein
MSVRIITTCKCNQILQQKIKVLPKRKPNRLKNYDYSQNGAYFVTMCTKNHANFLGIL